MLLWRIRPKRTEADFLYDRARLIESMIGGTTVNPKIPYKEAKDPDFTVASVAPSEWFLPIDATGATQQTNARS
jgi:sarcosine oxidase gamma subunit